MTLGFQALPRLCAPIRMARHSGPFMKRCIREAIRLFGGQEHELHIGQHIIGRVAAAQRFDDGKRSALCVLESLGSVMGSYVPGVVEPSAVLLASFSYKTSRRF